MHRLHIAPALAQWLPCSGAWSLIVPACPLCGAHHSHGSSVLPKYEHRVAHCVRGGRGGYHLVHVEVRQWARLLGTSEERLCKVLDDAPRRKLLAKVDRKFGLVPGTAEATLQAAALLAAKGHIPVSGFS